MMHLIQKRVASRTTFRQKAGSVTRWGTSLVNKDSMFMQEDILKLEMKVVDEAKKLCPDKYDWLEDDTIPAGWKYR
jgi:hypothetical protein